MHRTKIVSIKKYDLVHLEETVEPCMFRSRQFDDHYDYYYYYYYIISAVDGSYFTERTVIRHRFTTKQSKSKYLETDRESEQELG